MPELRSGARQARLRSKRLDDPQPSAQPFDQAEDLVPPAHNRGRRGGRGRAANAAGVGRGAATRQAGAGRGRGTRLTDLNPELPRVGLPGPVIGVPEEPDLNRVEGVGDRDLVMEGRSAEKLIGVEEDPSTAPVPERVNFVYPHFALCFFLSS